MKKSMLAGFLLLMLAVLLAGCSINEDPILFHISSPDVTEEKAELPIEVTVNYSISNNYKHMVGKNNKIVFTHTCREIDYECGATVFAVKEVDKHYQVLRKKHKNYPMENLSDFGYSDPITLDKQQGTFTIKFNTYEEYEEFRDDEIVNIDRVSEYFKKQSK